MAQHAPLLGGSLVLHCDGDSFEGVLLAAEGSSFTLGNVLHRRRDGTTTTLAVKHFQGSDAATGYVVAVRLPIASPAPEEEVVSGEEALLDELPQLELPREPSFSGAAATSPRDLWWMLGIVAKCVAFIGLVGLVVMTQRHMMTTLVRSGYSKAAAIALTAASTFVAVVIGWVRPACRVRRAESSDNAVPCPHILGHSSGSEEGGFALEREAVPL